MRSATLSTIVPSLLLLSAAGTAAPTSNRQQTSSHESRRYTEGLLQVRDQAARAPQGHVLLADLPHVAPISSPPRSSRSISRRSPDYIVGGYVDGNIATSVVVITSTVTITAAGGPATNAPVSSDPSSAYTPDTGSGDGGGAIPVTAPGPATAAAAAAATPTSTQPSNPSPASSNPSTPASQPAPDSLIINNHCAFPIYLWSIGDDTDGTQSSLAGRTTLAPSVGRYTSPYLVRASHQGGISIKLSRTPDLASSPVISQFEYTADPGQLIWYDWSNVNGNAFGDSRVVVHPLVDNGGDGSGYGGNSSGQGFGSCAVLDCPPGQLCEAAYTDPNDNWATHACPEGTGLVVELCAL